MGWYERWLAETWLGLSPYTVNILRRANIDPDDLPGMGDADLLHLPMFGTGRLAEVRSRAPLQSGAIANWVGEGTR